MDEILDQPLIQQEKSGIKYGTLGKRFLALIIDAIALSPLTFGLTYLNTGALDSSFVLVLVTLANIGYKPFMEFNYGATWGKMAMKLRVKNLEFEEASLREILLRNIFHIVPQLITLFFSIALYNDFDFGEGFVSEVSNQELVLFVNFAFGLIAIVDAIVLAADQENRSLHDKIGGTVVISES